MLPAGGPFTACETTWLIHVDNLYCRRGSMLLSLEARPGGRGMGKGLWRDGHWVVVSYEDRETIPISPGLYARRGYQPPLDELPTKEEYEARRDDTLGAAPA